LLVALVGAALVSRSGRRSVPPVTPDLRAALEPHLRLGAPLGLLYAPWLVPTASGVRGPEREAVPALDELAMHRRHDGADAELDFWLISGYLAAGQDRNAVAFLDDALVRHKGDIRFLNLVAIAAVKQGDLGDAEARLRMAIEHDTSGLTAFNLAAVLRAQGRRDEARRLLQHVKSSSPHPALVAYAAAVESAMASE
jgi:Flp pilus assembly protein TadD